MSKLANGDKAIFVEGEKLDAYAASRRWKSLNTTKTKILIARKKSKDLYAQSVADIKHYDSELDRIEAEMVEFDTHGVVVSEHAILRYIERFRGINLSEVVEEIKTLPEKLVVQHGNTIVTINEDKNENPKD